MWGIALSPDGTILASAGEDENLPDQVIDSCTRHFVRCFGDHLPVLVKTCRPGTLISYSSCHTTPTSSACMVSANSPAAVISS